jgi:hypothetical protein
LNLNFVITSFILTSIKIKNYLSSLNILQAQ